MTTDWREIDTLQLSATRGKNINSEVKHIMLSPYDVPYAYRLQSNGEYISINFRYINIDEPRSDLVMGNGVSFSMGKKTDRIYAVNLHSLIDVETEGMSSVEFEKAKSSLQRFIADRESHGKTTAKYTIIIELIRGLLDGRFDGN